MAGYVVRQLSSLQNEPLGRRSKCSIDLRVTLICVLPNPRTRQPRNEHDLAETIDNMASTTIDCWLSIASGRFGGSTVRLNLYSDDEDVISRLRRSLPGGSFLIEDTDRRSLSGTSPDRLIRAGRAWTSLLFTVQALSWWGQPSSWIGRTLGPCPNSMIGAIESSDFGIIPRSMHIKEIVCLGNPTTILRRNVVGSTSSERR
jgi:hypothetical protein